MARATSFEHEAREGLRRDIPGGQLRMRADARHARLAGSFTVDGTRYVVQAGGKPFAGKAA